MCNGKDIDDDNVKDDHQYVTSKFLAYRHSDYIQALPVFTIKGIIDMVKSLFHYRIMGRTTWKDKQTAFKVVYGD
jgi:hypothetical protein